MHEQYVSETIPELQEGGHIRVCSPLLVVVGSSGGVSEGWHRAPGCVVHYW